MNTAHNTKTYLQRRRLAGLLSLFVVAVLSVGLSFFLYRILLRQINTPEEFRAYPSVGRAGSFFWGCSVFRWLSRSSRARL